MHLKDRTGERFGRLTVLRRGPNLNRRLTAWICRCDCGNETNVRAHKLVGGATRSCGCLQAETRGVATITHGACIGGKQAHSAEYKTWASMKARCADLSEPRYGGRGIRVCDRWLENFPAFVADMGLRPSPIHSIDRIDPNRGYEPGNCRWATRLQQAGNTRANVLVVAPTGDRVALKELARREQVHYHRLWKFLTRYKLTLNQAVLAARHYVPRSGKEHTHCKRGHEMTPVNTRFENGGRQCRTCDRMRVNARARRRRDRSAA